MASASFEPPKGRISAVRLAHRHAFGNPFDSIQPKHALGTYSPGGLGKTLSEEIAACLLGGFGMKAELGLAAFARLRDRGLLIELTVPGALEKALCEPFIIHGQWRRYRFPRQKAHYLAACLQQLAGFTEPDDDAALRDQLTLLPGIGPKT